MQSQHTTNVFTASSGFIEHEDLKYFHTKRYYVIGFDINNKTIFWGK